MLSGWGARHPTDDYLDFERFVWEMVDEFDVPYVQAIGPVDVGSGGSFDEAGVRFGQLCDRAAEHGATIGLEFLPFTNIVDAADALAVVEAAGTSQRGSVRRHLAPRPWRERPRTHPTDPDRADRRRADERRARRTGIVRLQGRLSSQSGRRRARGRSTSTAS